MTPFFPGRVAVFFVSVIHVLRAWLYAQGEYSVKSLASRARVGTYQCASNGHIWAVDPISQSDAQVMSWACNWALRNLSVQLCQLSFDFVIRCPCPWEAFVLSTSVALLVKKKKETKKEKKKFHARSTRQVSKISSSITGGTRLAIGKLEIHFHNIILYCL